LAGIGAVAMAFNECESVIDALLIVGLGIPPELFEVLTQMGGLDVKVDIVKKAAVRELRFDVASFGAVMSALDELLEYKRHRDAIVHARLTDRKSGIGHVFKRGGKAYEVLLTAQALNALYQRLWSLKKDLDTISVTFDMRGYYLALDRAKEMIKKREGTPDGRHLVQDVAKTLALVQENQKKRQSLPPLPDFPDDRTIKTPEETPDEREKLLSGLRPHKRELIERLLDQHPGLTASETIEFLTAFDGL
jgi:hypothetical protein